MWKRSTFAQFMFNGETIDTEFWKREGLTHSLLTEGTKLSDITASVVTKVCNKMGNGRNKVHELATLCSSASVSCFPSDGLFHHPTSRMTPAVSSEGLLLSLKYSFHSP